MSRRVLWSFVGLLLSVVPVFAQDGPVPARDAAERISLPDGFHATLFAGEPDIVQPIAFTFDDRGRLWVVECLSYPEWETQGHAGRDRVVILEDENGDGRFDTKTVFWDEGTNLSGIEYGFGGVWLCSTPNLLFLPDRDGDDRPDGPPEVVLDGWDLKARHNVFNGLTWGPDGWLYGCNGILSNSEVGPPGTPDEQRIAMNCGVWRYHPTRRVFEVVAHGTTNPWGLDFDERGELFITNCVIEHLFHVTPGGHYQRMFGQDITPHVYGLMEGCADHIHWGGGHWTSSRGGQGEHDTAGGGHAHAGAMIYLGDNWPAEYRNSLLTCNIHGTRVNRDLLERHGSGYVAHHGKDFLLANDPWFRGLELQYGPDGGVYLTDWSDTGECHDYEDIHRENGRIYKITFGQPKPVKVDLSKLDTMQLVELQGHQNTWHARHARRILQERFATVEGGGPLGAILMERMREARDTARQLRLLWTTYVIYADQWEGSTEFLLDFDAPAVRSWAVRLELEDRAALPEMLQRFAALTESDPSPVVRLALASGLQRLPLEQRWEIAANLVAHGEDADDPNLPLMIWYGIEPLVAADHERAVELLSKTEILLVRRYIARRMAEDIQEPSSLVPLVALLQRTDDRAMRRDVLRGIHDVAQGLRDVPMPPEWPALSAELAESDEAEIRELATALSLIFGDRAALDRLRALLTDATAPTAERTRALVGLAQVRDAGLPKILYRLIESPELRGPALRGLAHYAAAETPSVILRHYESFSEAQKQDAVGTLSSRPEYALALLDAVGQGTVARTDLSTFAARQLASLGDERVTQKLEKVWGAVKTTSEEKARVIADYKAMLTPENLTSADPVAGRVVFSKTCAGCHQLFDAGRGVGPNLTGSQRTNVDYVLENLVDPNALIGRDYQMTTILTTQGRILTGIIAAETDNSLTLRTATEDVILPKGEIEARRQSSVSMMPEAMLDKLSDAEVLSLVRYLAGPAQVPLEE